MATRLVEWLFGCAHRRTSFPLTLTRRTGFAEASKGTYVACLDCGREFSYSWKEMKVVENQPSIDAPPSPEVVR